MRKAKVNMETWTVVASLAALFSAAIAAVYTWLTFRLVRSQSEPNVVVYVKHDESRTTILQIIIENIGRGIATDVTFKSSRPIPAHAWGISIDQAKPAETMIDGPLIKGIPALGPGDSRKISWGQYGGLMKALGNESLLLTFQYKDGSRQMPSRSVELECASFAHTDAVDSETVRMIKELPTRWKETNQILSGLPINVSVKGGWQNSWKYLDYSVTEAKAVKREHSFKAVFC
jgi:hypothetical protein